MRRKEISNGQCYNQQFWSQLWVGGDCRRLTYISKNVIWEVAANFCTNLTRILESWLWRLISFMYLNAFVTWSLLDYCSAMDLAEQFKITWPNQIALAKLGRGGSCKTLFICIWPAACLFPNWVRTPCSHVHDSGTKLKMCTVSQRWAQGTSKWEPQLRNPVLCFCPCNELWSCHYDCTGLC